MVGIQVYINLFTFAYGFYYFPIFIVPYLSLFVIANRLGINRIARYSILITVSSQSSPIKINEMWMQGTSFLFNHCWLMFNVFCESHQKYHSHITFDVSIDFILYHCSAYFNNYVASYELPNGRLWQNASSHPQLIQNHVSSIRDAL